MKTMKWIVLSVLCLALLSCGKKSEATELTPEEEIQVVDSAANETNAKIDSLSQSVDSLNSQIDSLLKKN
jgi:peptidoglycan hydrolase CwlO-like protein